MSELYLPSAGLLSKWGFGDGDIPDDFDDWLDARNQRMTGPGWRSLLCTLVREQLLPALDQAVDAVEIETIHNPIRAAAVDAVELPEDVWYGYAPEPKLTPDHVTVPYEVAFGRATELGLLCQP
jgi:hypothetical protein